MSDIEDDAQEEFEDQMLDRDKAVSEEHDTTAEALRDGSGLDERLKEERGAGSTDREGIAPTELDEVDDEPIWWPIQTWSAPRTDRSFRRRKQLCTSWRTRPARPITPTTT